MAHVSPPPERFWVPEPWGHQLLSPLMGACQWSHIMLAGVTVERVLPVRFEGLGFSTPLLCCMTFGKSLPPLNPGALIYTWGRMSFKPPPSCDLWQTLLTAHLIPIAPALLTTLQFFSGLPCPLSSWMDQGLSELIKFPNFPASPESMADQ